ncbi:hypothetical protein L9F63_020164, partial [Diploptera punctata]
MVCKFLEFSTNFFFCLKTICPKFLLFYTLECLYSIFSISLNLLLNHFYICICCYDNLEEDSWAVGHHRGRIERKLQELCQLFRYLYNKNIGKIFNRNHKSIMYCLSLQYWNVSPLVGNEHSNMLCMLAHMFSIVYSFNTVSL